MPRWYLSRLSVVAGALGVALATARCTGKESSAPPRAEPRRPLSAARAAAAVAQGLLPHGLPQVNWMAEVHTRAMQEALAIQAELRASSPRDRCARIEGIVRRLVPDIARHTGITDQAFYQARFAEARARSGCPETPALSVWGLPAPLPATEDSVTGEYQAYTGAMENAVLNAGSPEEAAAGIDAALAAGSSLPAADYQVLAGIASIAASSVYYWYQVEATSGGGAGGDQEYLMSIFPPTGWCGFWCKTGWADLFGAVGGAAAVIETAGPGALVAPEAVLAGSVIGAAVNSASTAIGLM